MKPNDQRGFTLVELLVTVTIIVVLAALVFTLSSRAISSAQKAVCVANFRGIGNAIVMYATENNSRLPGPLNTGQSAQYNGDYNSTPKGSTPAIATYIGQYMQGGIERPSGKAVALANFGCPSLTKRINRSASQEFPTLYRMQGILLKKLDGSKGQPWGYPTAGSPLTPWRMDEIDPVTAGRVIGMIEQDDSMTPNPWGKAASGPAHGSQRMALYFDWSVRAVSVSEWK